MAQGYRARRGQWPTAEDETVSTESLTHRGGTGRPLVLVHGLMGRGSTWSRQVPWLTRLGRGLHLRRAVAPRPRRRRFRARQHRAVRRRPRRRGRHSRRAGGARSGTRWAVCIRWCLAAQRPDLVSALVVEDMAPDFVGRTTGPWEPWLHALPVEFSTAEQVFDEFGPVAGQYFLDAFDRTATGWRLHGQPARWIEIAGAVGHRATTGSSGSRFARRRCSSRRVTRLPRPVRCGGWPSWPASVPRYVHVPDAGHLVHDDAPGPLPRGRGDVPSGAPRARLTTATPGVVRTGCGPRPDRG